MANKHPLQIELKEISPNYPSLQDESEYPEESKERPAPVRPPPQNLSARPPTQNLSAAPRPVSSNAPSTANTSAVPPGLSYLDQQRLRNSGMLQPPPVGVQGQNVGMVQSMPQMVPSGFMVVQCSGCRGAIHYPMGVSIVCCTVCRATTATRPLINIVCYFCKNSAFYPAENSHVRCKCGTMYAVRPG